MAQTPSAQSGSPALDQEADHVDRLMKGGDGKEAPQQPASGGNGLNNATQVEQDNRVDKAKADAKAAGGGPDTPEDGVNQDG